MKTLRQVRSRRSRFNRETQFWREARERYQHQEGITHKKKGISLKEAKTNYQTYWKRYNRTAAIALGGFCSFCRTAPCSCDQLYGNGPQTQKANADTGYDATPSTSHLSNQAHLVKRVPRLTPGQA